MTIEDIYKNIPFTSYQNKAFASIMYLGVMGERYIETKLAEFNISTQQFRILRLLRRTPDGMPIYTIAQYLPDRKSDISRLIERMHKSGLVSRKRDKKDKRVYNVLINQAGLNILAAIDSKEGDINFDIPDFNEEKAKILYEHLQVLVDAFYKALP